MRYVRDRLFIDGEWRRSSDEGYIEVTSPATEEVVGVSTAAGLPDVEVAVAAARRALTGEWAALDLSGRAEVLFKAADLLEQRGQAITELLAWEMGSPVGGGSGYLRSPLSRIRKSFPAAASKVPLREVRRDEEGAVLIQQDAVGVVVAITPWNTNFGGVVLKSIPALLAGCPVILKPSPLTPLDPFELAEALEAAGLPRGLFNVLPGGSEIGVALVGHPGVDMVTFTGSSAVGQTIAVLAAETMKRVVLECGGKSAAIVLDDAELDSTVGTITGAAFALSGQYCRALSRVLTPRGRYDEIIDALEAAARRITVGDPFDPQTRMGPLVSAAQRDRSERYVASGIKEGARLVSGGKRPPDLPVGYYFEPTIFADVDNAMELAQEEIFGPVLSVIPYEDVDDAIRIANDSIYGLSGAVFTRDVNLGLEIASRVDTGLIGINAQGARESASCAGVKLSGIGDEHGPEGFREFLRARSVIIPDGLAESLEAKGTPVSWVSDRGNQP